MTRKMLATMIKTQPESQTGDIGQAMKTALAKIEAEVAAQAEYDLHEMACNIAEDLDNGAIFDWRLDEVKAHLRAGGTTCVRYDETTGEAEVFLVNAEGEDI